MRLCDVLPSIANIPQGKGVHVMQSETQAILTRHKRPQPATSSSKDSTCGSQEKAGERMPPAAPCVDGKIVRGPNGGPSHKQTGSRGRLSCVLDDALVSLFEEERRTRGLTISKLVSIILWNRYGCPKLSFE